MSIDQYQTENNLMNRAREKLHLWQKETVSLFEMAELPMKLAAAAMMTMLIHEYLKIAALLRLPPETIRSLVVTAVEEFEKAKERRKMDD